MHATYNCVCVCECVFSLPKWEYEPSRIDNAPMVDRKTAACCCAFDRPLFTHLFPIWASNWVSNIYQRHTEKRTQLDCENVCTADPGWNEMDSGSVKWFVVHEPRKKSHKYIYTYTINKQKYNTYAGRYYASLSMLSMFQIRQKWAIHWNSWYYTYSNVRNFLIVKVPPKSISATSNRPTIVQFSFHVCTKFGTDLRQYQQIIRVIINHPIIIIIIIEFWVIFCFCMRFLWFLFWNYYCDRRVKSKQMYFTQSI